MRNFVLSSCLLLGWSGASLVEAQGGGQPRASISEGTSLVVEGGSISFTVSLSEAAPSGGLAVNVLVRDAAGAEQSFLVESDTGRHAVEIGGGSRGSTFTVGTVDDETHELRGIVSAVIEAGTGYAVGDPAIAFVTVADNDAPPDQDSSVIGASIHAQDQVPREGASISFLVQLSADAPAGGLPVAVDVAEVEGGDFVAAAEEGSRTVRVAAGARSGTFTVQTIDDATDEPNGMVAATLQAGAGYAVNDPSVAHTNVIDNDGLEGPESDPPPASGGGGGGPTGAPPDSDDEDDDDDDPDDDGGGGGDPQPEPDSGSCVSRITPYWHGTGGFAVRPTNGRSATVRLSCGRSRWSSQEFAGEDGLIVRAVQQSMCLDGDEQPVWGELEVEGVDDDGWYWINGDRNVAVAPLVCESSLNSALRPPVPAGVTVSPSANDRFSLSIMGRLYGTLMVHDFNGLVGIIPHLKDMEGNGEHVAPYWRGHGGIVGRPLDGESATVRLSCGDGAPETHTLLPGDDGIIVSLLPGCFDVDGDPIDGKLEADGLEDGAWYWLNQGRLATGPPRREGTGISTAVPLVRRKSAPGTLAEPVVPNGVNARPGPLGTLFTRGRLMGVVPRVQATEQP